MCRFYRTAAFLFLFLLSVEKQSQVCIPCRLRLPTHSFHGQFCCAVFLQTRKASEFVVATRGAHIMKGVRVIQTPQSNSAPHRELSWAPTPLRSQCGFPQFPSEERRLTEAGVLARSQAASPGPLVQVRPAPGHCLLFWGKPRSWLEKAIFTKGLVLDNQTLEFFFSQKGLLWALQG